MHDAAHAIALLAALSAVGIDLTALSVLGGAIGVGVGLGLQKIAANYVSGFVVLAERALRLGRPLPGSAVTLPLALGVLLVAALVIVGTLLR